LRPLEMAGRRGPAFGNVLEIMFARPGDQGVGPALRRERSPKKSRERKLEDLVAKRVSPSDRGQGKADFSKKKPREETYTVEGRVRQKRKEGRHLAVGYGPRSP